MSHFFATMMTLWPELWTLPRGSRGSTFGPNVALDSLFHLGMGCLVFVPAKKQLHAVGTNEFFWVLRRVRAPYTVGVTPCSIYPNNFRNLWINDIVNPNSFKIWMYEPSQIVSLSLNSGHINTWLHIVWSCRSHRVCSQWTPHHTFSQKQGFEGNKKIPKSVTLSGYVIQV